MNILRYMHQAQSMVHMNTRDICTNTEHGTHEHLRYMCRVKFFRRSNIKKSNSFYKIYSLLYFPVVDKQNKHTAAQILWQSA